MRPPIRLLVVKNPKTRAYKLELLWLIGFSIIIVNVGGSSIGFSLNIANLDLSLTIGVTAAEG